MLLLLLQIACGVGVALSPVKSHKERNFMYASFACMFMILIILGIDI